MDYKNLWSFIFLWLFTGNLFCQSPSLPDTLHITFPDYTISSIPYEAEFETGSHYNGFLPITVNGIPDSVQMKQGHGIYTISGAGKNPLQIQYDGRVFEFQPSPIPLWWSIFPPLLAIAMALLFKEVVISLFVGVFFGAAILHVYTDGLLGVIYGLMRTIDHYMITALTETGHVSIILFSLLIGGTVAIISKNGGMQGVVDKISGYAKNARSGQLSTWALGIAVFFDDYANSLVVGNTMRPVTDRLRISREKLAYLVDSTAAPVTSIAFVTTWIGAELGYIESGIKNLDTLNEGVYETFLLSLQYAFYPIFTLGFMLILILLNKDFGPMHKAEVRARTTGEVSRVGLQAQKGDSDLSEFNIKSGIQARWYNAAIPIFVIIVGTLAGLLYTGWNEEIWLDEELGWGRKLSAVIGDSDSFKALLWSSLGGVITAGLLSLSQRILKTAEIMTALVSGFKTMLPAIIILTLAWSLAEITDDLHTAEFLTGIMSENVSPYWVPGITFILGAFVSFSTGSSWGTMAILYPLLLPASWIMSESAGLDYAASLSLFHNVTASVLAGSVLGDHCSPISDTTILSSLATSCHHIDHVRTQMPYALTVGGVALVFGVLPAAAGISSWILFPAGWFVIFLIIRFFGRPVPS